MIDGIKGPAGAKGPIGGVSHGYIGLRLPRLKDLREQFEASREIVERVINMPYAQYKAQYEEEVVKEEAYEAALEKGFQGSFEEYGKMMEGRPKGPTGLSAGPGLVGHSRSSTSIMDDTSFLKLDKKEKLNHMYERAKSEGWYKGTLDDFRKFEDRSHWIPYHKFNKDIDIHLDESQLQHKRESYELALKLFYRGTLEDFLLFTTNYCWGPVRKDTYID